MSIQTSATPLNGREAATMLKNQSNHLIDATPMLDEATSFHRCTLEGEFKLTAYPEDVPVPAKEFKFNVDSINTKRGENEEIFEYVKKLETNREELLHLLQKIDEELGIYAPQTKVEFKFEAGDEPDKLRIEQGLPIPVVRKVGGRNVETYVNAQQNKVTGAFQLGGNKK
jgi:hypothetical protein